VKSPKTHYGRDLSYVHDVGFTSYVREAMPGLFALLRKHEITGGQVVDLGCGSGVWARELTRQGYRVLGVDLSPSMLRLARRRAPQARFVQKSLLEFDLPRCDAVTAIGEPLNYLFDGKNSFSRLFRLFQRIHAALAPGGLFIFDLATPGRSGQDGLVLSHREGKDWAILLRTQEDRQTRILTRQMTVFRKVGRNYRRSEETHRLRLYPRGPIEQQLRTAGFQVRVAETYGTSPPRPGLLVFIARKT
jgi:SAM-dependent methyltransferase